MINRKQKSLCWGSSFLKMTLKKKWTATVLGTGSDKTCRTMFCYYFAGCIQTLGRLEQRG